MIPLHEEAFGYLPPGIHDATWLEVCTRFGGTQNRKFLLEGLLTACKNLALAGCKTVLLNGSFVTSKVDPEDYDAAWEPVGVELDFLDPVLLDFNSDRRLMKAKYRGDLFPASIQTSTGEIYRDFFKTDRHGNEKGIVKIDLRSLP